MGTLTTVVDDKFIKLIDSVIFESKQYSSRSEFLKDSVRKNLDKVIQFNNELRELKLISRKFALKAIANGWDGSLITREQKEASAQKLLRQQGLIK